MPTKIIALLASRSGSRSVLQAVHASAAVSASASIWIRSVSSATRRNETRLSSLRGVESASSVDWVDDGLLLQSSEVLRKIFCLLRQCASRMRTEFTRQTRRNTTKFWSLSAFNFAVCSMVESQLFAVGMQFAPPLVRRDADSPKLDRLHESASMHARCELLASVIPFAVPMVTHFLKPNFQVFSSGHVQRSTKPAFKRRYNAVGC